MIQINVLKSEKRGKGKKKSILTTSEAEKQTTYMAVGVFAVIGLIIFLMWWTQNNKIGSLRDSVASLTAKKNSPELKNVEKQLKQLEKKQQIINKKIEIIDKLKKFRTVPVEVMDLISKHIPDQVWLINMDYKTGFIRISGYAFSNELVAKFISTLEGTGNFNDFNLLNSTKVVRGGVDLYRFNMNFKFIVK
jgi:type IV pilus assembly protein PilN